MILDQYLMFLSGLYSKFDKKTSFLWPKNKKLTHEKNRGWTKNQDHAFKHYT